MTENAFEDVNGQIVSSTQEIFSTMVPMDISPKDSFYQKEEMILTDVISLVSFTGEYSGIIALFCARETAFKMTSSMLGIEVHELNNDTKDAVGEITNMIAGTLKNKVCEKFGAMHLSVPIVIAGANLTISSSSGSEFHNVQITPSLTCDSQNSWLMTPFQSEGKVFNVGLIVKKCD